ncbi:MAG: acetylxylan esterase [Planctomycetota bacterium]|nr:acetylxylan esterase [Planctomycetota bacterium]
MPEPDDFGLAPFATLAHVGDAVSAPQHRPFWSRWQEAVTALTPTLGPAEPADPSDQTATHRFESLGSVRIGCRLELPPKGTPVRAGLVTTHGYATPDPLETNANRFRALAARGVAVLALRVRGFPGSQLDTGDWTGDPHSLGWITQGFPARVQKPEDALRWSLPLAVADVACAGRALREWLGTRARKGDAPAPDMYLRGESFGGGLAVIAAAQTPRDWMRFDRLAIGLPTFGDWAWRLANPARMALGSGAEMLALLRSLGEETQTEALDTLRLCDAAVHARKVRTPTLCKLALRDEVVPAPTAAAVFNALDTDPGSKWRFVVPTGHTEPSLALARRLAIYERCAADFLDPAQEPAAAIETWASLLEEGDRVPGRVSDHADHPLTGAQTGLFGTAPSRDRTDELLVAAYERAARTLDDLPYTPEWATLFAEAGGATGMREREVFHALHNLRKAGKLPRLGRATSSPPRINAEEESQLGEHVVRLIGSLGQRDRLPFTPEFDRLVEWFNTTTGRELSPHDVWRLIARIAK